MNQDEEHLKLLSVFHYVAAGMAILTFGCFPMIHLVVGIALLAGGFEDTSSGHGAHMDQLMGLLFVVVGGGMVLFGWTLAAVLFAGGRCLARRKRYTFCLVVAAISCIFMPFGTVLGIFTIIVLLRPSVKELFDVHDRTAPAA